MSNAYRAVVQSGGGAAVGDATAADVLTGKTFSGAVGSGVTGTMPNRGAVSGTATPSQPYTIPAGYHNGSGVVIASTVGDLLVNNGDYIDVSTAAADLPIVGTYSGTAIGPASGNTGHVVIVNVSNYTTATANGSLSFYAWSITNGVVAAITLPTSGSTFDISAYDYIVVLVNNRQLDFS